ncbi:MAG: 3-oxoacyl-ACP reductase FabG [Lachnospiraceae bacterium]
MNYKTVLVTGASRGIGRAIALTFASHGYYVYINAHQSVSELAHVKQTIESNGGFCQIVSGDVGNSFEVQKMFDVIIPEGGLDVLINNAGIAHIGLLSDMTDEEWHRILQTNLSSAFYCSRLAIPQMVTKKQGKIINISSMWGTAGASCEVAYSATKAGLHGFTKALAKELAPSNIQVNAIACGVVDTIMNQQLTEEERQILKDEIPAGRFATPEEVAALTFSLASDHAYMTGQIIGFDGGMI